MGSHPDRGVSVFDLPFHPTTGLQAIGIGRRGPIWPVMGASEDHPSDPPAGDPPADPPPSTDPPADPPDRGFPPNTPIKDMTADQQAAYWKFHDRRKSDTLSAYDGITPEQAKQFKKDADEARRNQLQPSERALEDARTEAATTAAQQASVEWAGQLTEAIVGQFVQEAEQRTAVLAGINPMTFVKDGKFDKDALIGHLTGLAAAFGGAAAGELLPRQWGQAGSQPPATSGRDEGLAEAKRRGYIKD